MGGGCAQRVHRQLDHGKPAVVEPKRLGSAAEIGNPGPFELGLGGQAQQAMHALSAQSGKVRFEAAIAVPPCGMKVRRMPSAPPSSTASNTTLSRGDASPDGDASVVVQSSRAKTNAAKSTSRESSTSRSRSTAPG